MTSKKPISANNINVTGDFIAGDQYNYYYTGDFASLAEYYIPPAPVFQRVRTDDFIGRDWLTAKVDAFLNDPNRKSGAFLLIGDAGVGKTAFMAHLVKERRYLHLFAEQAPGQAMLQRAMQSLGSQLVTRYQIDPYKDRDTLNALSVFPDFLERILRLAASTLTEGEKIVIVCDALDEAGTFPDHFVFGLPKELPDGVYFILSQRPVNVKLPNFEPVIENLEAQGEGNLQDIEAYLSAVAKRPEVAGQIHSKEYSKEFFIQTLKEKSQGVWMYLHYIIKEIESGTRAPLDLANLPTGLVGYYAEYWEAWRTGKRGKGEEAWDELYAPLLTTLAAAQEAIPVDWLIQWADVTAKPREVTRLLTEHWRAFITEKEKDGVKTYTPYHLSLKDFITGRVETDKLQPALANLVKDLATQTIDAHKRIVCVFEKDCESEWEKLVKQDYPRLHLTAHLNGAEEHEKLRILLTEGNEKIKWAEAKHEVEETYAGYLSDLAYIWTCSEKNNDVILAIRCMLIQSSIHSLASNIPPNLLTELAKSGLWSYARCLSTIKEKIDVHDKIKSLEIIAPNIPQSLLPDAILVAQEIQDDYARVQALVPLIPHLKDNLKHQIVQSIIKLQSQSDDIQVRIKILKSILQHITDEDKIHLIRDAVAFVGDYENEYPLTYLLQTLASCFDDALKSDAVDDAQKILDENVRSEFLINLLPYLNDNQKLKILSETLEIKDLRSRAKILAAMIQWVNDDVKPNVLQWALSAINEIKDEYSRTRILATLAPYISQELRKQVVSSLEHEFRNYRFYYFKEDNGLNILVDLFPYLNEEIQKEAFAIVEKSLSNEHQVEFLSKIAINLNPELALQIHQEALALVSTITNVESCAYTLSYLLPHLDDQLVKQAYTIAETFDFKQIDNDTVVELAKCFNNELRLRALQEKLADVQKIGDKDKSAYVLATLAPYLSEPVRGEVFLIASTIQSESDRSSAFIAIAPTFEKVKKMQLLRAVEAIQDESIRARTLYTLAAYFNDDLTEQIIDISQEIKDEFNRSKIFLALVPFVDDKNKSLFFLDTCKLMSESVRANNLINLKIYLNDEDKEQAFVLISQIKDVSTRARTLANFLPYLNNNNLTTKAIELAEEMNEYDGARTLAAFVPYIEDKLRSKVFSFALTLKDEVSAAIVLGALCPYLSYELKIKAILTIHNFKNSYAKVLSLSALVPHLTDEIQNYLFHESLHILSKMKSSTIQSQVISNLVPQLEGNFRKASLQAIFIISRNIEDEACRTSALKALIPYLVSDLKFNILDAILEIKDDYFRSRALTLLALKTKGQFRSYLFRMAFLATSKIDDEADRSVILKSLIPYIQDDLMGWVLKSVEAIKNETYRNNVLIYLIKYLPNELKAQALPIIGRTKNVSQRSQVLTAFIPHLNYEERIDLLKEMLYESEKYALSTWSEFQFKGLIEIIFPFLKMKSQQSRKSGLEAISALTPALVHFRGPEIADELYRTITDVTRWWP